MCIAGEPRAFNWASIKRRLGSHSKDRAAAGASICVRIQMEWCPLRAGEMDRQRTFPRGQRNLSSRVFSHHLKGRECRTSNE